MDFMDLYDEAKREAGDAVLLFRFEDSQTFHAFGDDAWTCQSVLGTPVAGVGTLAASHRMSVTLRRCQVKESVAKLIAAGHEVAVFERVDSLPKGADVERHIVYLMPDDHSLTDEGSQD